MDKAFSRPFAGPLQASGALESFARRGKGPQMTTGGPGHPSTYNSYFAASQLSKVHPSAETELAICGPAQPLIILCSRLRASVQSPIWKCSSPFVKNKEGGTVLSALLSLHKIITSNVRFELFQGIGGCAGAGKRCCSRHLRVYAGEYKSRSHPRQAKARSGHDQ